MGVPRALPSPSLRPTFAAPSPHLLREQGHVCAPHPGPVRPIPSPAPRPAQPVACAQLPESRASGRLAEPCGLPENSSRAPGTRGRQGKQEVSSWAQGPGGCGVLGAQGGAGRHCPRTPAHPPCSFLLPRQCSLWAAPSLPGTFLLCSPGPARVSTLSNMPTHSVFGARCPPIRQEVNRMVAPKTQEISSPPPPESLSALFYHGERISLVPPLGSFRLVSPSPYPLFLGLSFPI